jgi:hypothetical protein
MQQLFFGSTEVKNNDQISVNTLKYPPKVYNTSILLFYHIPSHHVYFYTSVISYTQPYLSGAYRVLVLDEINKNLVIDNKLSGKCKGIIKFTFFVTGLPALPTSLQQYLLLSEWPNGDSLIDIKGVLSAMEVYPHTASLSFLKKIARKWLTKDETILEKYTENDIVLKLDILDRLIRKDPIMEKVEKIPWADFYFCALIGEGLEIPVRYWYRSDDKTANVAWEVEEEAFRNGIPNLEDFIDYSLERVLVTAAARRQTNVINEIIRCWPNIDPIDAFGEELLNRDHNENVEILRLLFPLMINKYGHTDCITDMFDDKFIEFNCTNVELLKLMLTYPVRNTLLQRIYLHTQDAAMREVLLKHDPTLGN